MNHFIVGKRGWPVITQTCEGAVFLHTVGDEVEPLQALCVNSRLPWLTTAHILAGKVAVKVADKLPVSVTVAWVTRLPAPRETPVRPPTSPTHFGA